MYIAQSTVSACSLLSVYVQYKAWYGDALIRVTMKAAAKTTDLNNNDNKLRSYIANNNLTKNNEIFGFLNCHTFYRFEA